MRCGEGSEGGEGQRRPKPLRGASAPRDSARLVSGAPRRKHAERSSGGDPKKGDRTGAVNYGAWLVFPGFPLGVAFSVASAEAGKNAPGTVVHRAAV